MTVDEGRLAARIEGIVSKVIIGDREIVLDLDPQDAASLGLRTGLGVRGKVQADGSIRLLVSRHTLQELIDQCDPNAPVVEEPADAWDYLLTPEQRAVAASAPQGAALIQDRYRGGYSGGLWIAIDDAKRMENGRYRIIEVLEEAQGDDGDAIAYWQALDDAPTHPEWLAVGNTPDAALEALRQKLLAAETKSVD